MAQKFDALIIGTGQSGPALAARLDSEGLKVAVVEHGKFGGTCVNDAARPPRRSLRAPTPRTGRAARANMGWCQINLGKHEARQSAQGRHRAKIGAILGLVSVVSLFRRRA